MRDEELGDLLEGTFRSHADDAPQAHHGELAATARRRVRRRRHAMVGTAAAIVAFAGIGVVWTALDPVADTGTADSAGSAAGGLPEADRRDVGTPMASQATPAQLDPASAKAVVYRGVQVRVPATWITGVSGWPWCLPPNRPAAASRGQRNGELGLPGAVPAVGCNPVRTPVDELGEHVWLSPSAAEPGRTTERLGGGWIRDTVVINGVAVEVQTHGNPALRRDLLAAIRIV